MDYNNNKITIDKAIAKTKGKGIIITKPKTENKVIKVDETIIYYLKQLYIEEAEKKLKLGLDWQGENNLLENYIFTNEYGKRYYPQTLFSTWNKFLKRDKIISDIFKDVIFPKMPPSKEINNN